MTLQQRKRKKTNLSNSARKLQKLNEITSSASPVKGTAQSPTSKTPTMDLTDMTAEERHQLYKTLFSKKVESMKKLEAPDLANEFPTHGSEIIEAYLHHTIFTVPVWINFDTKAERYYYDSRAKDCGFVRLHADYMKSVEQLEFSKIRFEIGTPFMQLGTVTVLTGPFREGEGIWVTSVRARFWQRVPQVLHDGLDNICNNIKHNFVPRGEKGLNQRDVCLVASLFCFHPGEDEYNFRGWLRDTSIWMNLERHEENNINGFVACVS